MKLIDKIKAYFKREVEKTKACERRRREAEIRDAFKIRRTENGNYYLMCGNIFIERYEREEQLALLEARLSFYADNALRYDRQENE